jgi:hypothetical protein
MDKFTIIEGKIEHILVRLRWIHVVGGDGEVYAFYNILSDGAIDS